MRVLGLGWTEYATRWSSKADARIGTVAHLKELLCGTLLAREAADRQLGKLPEEAAPPHQATRDLGTLGTADPDALAIERKALFSEAELAAKAEAAMQRRVETGVADPVEYGQNGVAPAFDQALVGKRIEVLWKCVHPHTHIVPTPTPRLTHPVYTSLQVH